MNAKEAILQLKTDKWFCTACVQCLAEMNFEEMDIAVEALEKQIPKKPRETMYALMCANCGHKITEKGCKKLNRNYCKKCGQAIDWGV